MTTEQAILDIIAYQTLPPQIDFTQPYKFKATRAQEYLETLSTVDKETAEHIIESTVSNYFGSGVAEMDAKF